jgi:hypothetical protein
MKTYPLSAILLSLAFILSQGCNKCPDPPDEQSPQNLTSDDVNYALRYKEGDSIYLLRDNKDTLLFVAGAKTYSYDRSKMSHDPNCPKIEPLQQCNQDFTCARLTNFKYSLRAYVLPSYEGYGRKFLVQIGDLSYGPIDLFYATTCDRSTVSKDITIRGMTYCVTQVDGLQGKVYYSSSHGVVMIDDGTSIFEKLP